MSRRWITLPVLALAAYLALLTLTFWVALTEQPPPTAMPKPPKAAAVHLPVTLQQVQATDTVRLDRMHERLRQERQERRAAAEAAARAAEREAEEQAPVQMADAIPTSGGCTGLPADLLMVCQHESGGNATAYNPTGCLGGCYGLFQMSGEYMDGWAINAGYPGYAYAGHWPADVQRAVALWMYNQPDGLETYWCRWTSYC